MSDPAGQAHYQQPEGLVLAAMRAPLPPVPIPDPTGSRLLMVYWKAYATLEHVATPHLRLAGLCLDPRNHFRRDVRPYGYGLRDFATGYELVDIVWKKSTAVDLPDGNYLRPVWNATGNKFAFERVTSDAVELWIGDGRTGSVRQVPGACLNEMLGDEVMWMPDQTRLMVKLVPRGLPPPPPKPTVPLGPTIQQSLGKTGYGSSYEAWSPLKDEHDEVLFEYYARSQIALVDVNTLHVDPVGEVGSYRQVSPAPSARHVLVTTIERPYSYKTTYNRFPQRVAIWSLDGAVVTAQLPFAELKLADRVPFHGVRTGKRHCEWMPSENDTLICVEALDEGDWARPVHFRDEIQMISAPFEQCQVVMQLQYRFESIDWMKTGRAIVHSTQEVKGRKRAAIVDVRRKPSLETELWDLSVDEKYADPGEFVTRMDHRGFWVIDDDNECAYLQGSGATPQGARPFLDLFCFGDRRTVRIFRCAEGRYESFLCFHGRRIVTSRESSTEPPNVWCLTPEENDGGEMRDEHDNQVAGEATRRYQGVQVTHFKDPVPAARNIGKRVFHYPRRDGVELSCTLYTPPGYDGRTRLPTVLHGYPLDHVDRSTAGQTSGSPAKFTTFRHAHYRLLVLAGYAVVTFSCPVIGERERAYDDYMQQVFDNARATIDVVVESGVVDGARIVVMGDSHGALMTVNLATRPELGLKAGMAFNGNYDKTQSPFGFQNEKRRYWDAPDTYLSMSPFHHATEIKIPILLLYGEEDSNPGTPPRSSCIFYDALRGTGGTARLVSFPCEGHWLEADISNEHCVVEKLRWLNLYVRG